MATIPCARGRAASRRNRVEPADDRIALGIGVFAGVAAAFAGAAPTGSSWVDAVLVISFTIVVTWASSSAPWWVLLASSGLVLGASVGGPVVVTALAAVPFGAAAWLAMKRMSRPPLRAAIGACVVNVAMRIEWDPFFTSSAIVAGLATLGIGLLGIRRRPGHLRKRAVWVAVSVGACAVVAAGLLAIATLQARSSARAGYLALLDGLELVQNGQPADAALTLREAADQLDAAHDDIGGLLGRPAQLVPVLAQNRNASVELLAQASAAALSAADTLAVVDLDQLTVSNGVIDLAAFETLADPLADLDETITELRDTLIDQRSPWLIAPIATRVDTSIDRAEQAATQAAATAMAAEVGPDLLGANEPRRYFVMFVNAAEARGLSGLMGNWSELTIDNGRLTITANGRTADLQGDVLRALELEAPQEYIDRYAFFGARANRGVARKYWSNVTMTPDMPSVGNAVAQMYEVVTDRPIDGVFVIDAVGLAALMEITGPVEVVVDAAPDDIIANDDADDGTSADATTVVRRIDGSNAAEFLSIGQYEFAENEREDLLEAITQATIENVLTGSLPAPQRMVTALAPAALHGHIAGWAVEPDEQALFELIGMDASLPVIDVSGMDAIAVSNHNGGGNKIDSFLERRIEYRPVVDEGTGETTATMRVEFTNTAPSSGYTDYVIGNLVDAPPGTNRMIVDVYTRLGVDAVRVDGEPVSTIRKPELGYWVTSRSIDVGPGETSVLELDLSGDVGPGGYQLAYRPQPLPNPDELVVIAVTDDGTELFDFDGQLERRSVINRLGVSAWR